MDGWIILIIIILGLLSPFLYFIEGWFIGCLLKITIGNILISGFALIGLQLSPENLPLFFGTIATIASFFRTPTKINKKEQL